MSTESNKEYNHGLNPEKLQKIKTIWKLYRNMVGLEGEAKSTEDLEIIRELHKDSVKEWYEKTGRKDQPIKIAEVLIEGKGKHKNKKRV